ncbi:MAG: MFS transporter [Phototrophicales bacterium]|nr:MFS transporter [Phototrophicales bacterium]
MPYNLLKINIVYFCTRFHIYIHAYALLLQNRGLSLFQISIIESVVIASIFLMEIPTGILADKIGRKWSITASVFLMMCAELLFLFSRSYPTYLVVALLTGTGFAFASGAIEALIYDSLPPDDRENTMKRAMGRYGSIGQIAFFLSPLVGVFVLGDLAGDRFDLAIIITVLVLFIGMIACLTLKEPPSTWDASRQPVTQIFRDGIGNIRHNRPLQRLMALIVFTTPFNGLLVTTFAAPTMTQNQIEPQWIALALSLGSLLAVFTQRMVVRIEQFLGKKWGLTALIVLPSLSWMLLGVMSGNMVWLVIVWMYATNDMRYPLISAYQNALIPDKNRATTLSLMNMFTSLFIGVASPIYAAIGTYSLPVAFMAIGGVIFLGAIVSRVDKMTTPLSEG